MKGAGQGRGLFFTALLSVVFASILVSHLSLREFRAEIEPELSKKAQTVGESVRTYLEKVLGYGLDLASLRGMQEYLDGIAEANPEITHIALSDPDGRMLFSTTGYSALDSSDRPDKAQAFEVKLPLLGGNSRVGTIYVGQDQRYADRQMEAIRLDIITVVAIGALIAFELLVFWTATAFVGPQRAISAAAVQARDGELRQRLSLEEKGAFRGIAESINTSLDRLAEAYGRLAQRIESIGATADNGVRTAFSSLQTRYRLSSTPVGTITHHKPIEAIRWPFFLVIFADSLSVSFFPFFVESVYTPIAGISREVLVSVPISVFMLVWAIALPFAGAWSDRIGRKRSFLIGASITALGLLMTAAAEGLMSLLAWRSLTALGYAIVFITAQGYVTDNTTQENRTRGMAGFVAGFFGGMLCGAAIGGILAERLGFRTTFIVSAVLGLLAAMFVLRFMEERHSGGTGRKMRFADFRLLFHNGRFISVALLAAIPSKLALTGFIYYAVLMYLQNIGTSQGDIGRAMVAYGAAIVLLSPFAARLVDRARSRGKFVVAGSFLASAGMLIPYLYGNLPGAVASIALLGIGHAVAVPAQLALATEVSRQEVERIGSGAVMGIFRLVERAGNVVGPLLAGALMALYSFEGAVIGMAAINFGAAIAFAFMLFLFRGAPDKSREVAA